jgi:hypothetical protein
MRRRKSNFSKLAFDAAKLGVTASMVIGLRVARIAMGGPRAKTEIKRMVSEKVTAARVASMSVATDALIGRAHKSPAKTLALYQKRVSANLRRLSKGE